jgi:hypothetical protein
VSPAFRFSRGFYPTESPEKKVQIMVLKMVFRESGIIKPLSKPFSGPFFLRKVQGGEASRSENHFQNHFLGLFF